jgi:hypothetical protein
VRSGLQNRGFSGGARDNDRSGLLWGAAFGQSGVQILEIRQECRVVCERRLASRLVHPAVITGVASALCADLEQRVAFGSTAPLRHFEMVT